MTEKEDQNQESQVLPSDDVLLNHLFPLRIPEIITGYWEPGKKYLMNEKQDTKVFIIDEIGDFVWKRCDGTNSVRKIEQLLIKEADQDEKGVRTSVATFLMNLKEKGYITFDQRG